MVEVEEWLTKLFCPTNFGSLVVEESILRRGICILEVYWVKNKLTDVKECHLYHICKGNTFSSTKTLSREVVESFGEIASLGLVRELGRHKS